MEELEDSFDEIIELIEVSIHSNDHIQHQKKVLPKPQAHSHELDLRVWRYLGMTQMRDSRQVFFMMGKGV